MELSFVDCGEGTSPEAETAMDRIPGNNPSPWGMLHDGTLVGMERIGPILRATIECQYVRERFDDPGERFIFELVGCTRVELTPYDEATITDLETISRSDWEVLDAGAVDNAMRVYLHEGNLQLEYESLTIHVDSGRIVPLDELTRHVREYWDEFGKRS